MQPPLGRAIFCRENMESRTGESDLRFLTRPEAARRYRVGLRTIDRWIREGRLPKVQLGARCIRLPQQLCDAAVLKFLVEPVIK